MTDNRNQPMSDLACRAFGAGFAEISGFDAPGIIAELQRQREHFDPLQLVVAMARRCADPANTSPALQPFDHVGFVSCSKHPGASVRTDGTCGVCHSEAHGSDEPYQREATDAGHPLRDAIARVSR